MLSLISYAFTQIPGAVFGFVVAAFCPSIGRFLKKLYVKYTTKAKTAVIAEEQKIAKKL